jgi:serine/threonine-protein kinase
VATITATPDADPPREAPNVVSGRPARSRLLAIAAVAALALSAAAVAIAAAPMLRSAPGTIAINSTAPTAPEATGPAPVVAAPLTTGSPAVRPSATPSPASASPSDATSTSPSPADPIVALRQAIGQQVTAGGLKADAAADLNHNVDDLAHTITTGNTGAVTTKITALRAKLTALNKGGKLSADGYRVLNSALDQVAASQG